MASCPISSRPTSRRHQALDAFDLLGLQPKLEDLQIFAHVTRVRGAGQQHREAVHALATEAGVRVPWIVEAIADDIERERRSAAW